MQRRQFLLSMAAGAAASAVLPGMAGASAGNDPAPPAPDAASLPRRRLGTTGLEIAPVVLGGNVFGWSIDEKASFEVLDAFVDLGFDAIDTADVYSRWAPGNSGGESETIIGRWLKARPGLRGKVKLFTKVGGDMGAPERKGLSPRWIAT